MCHRVQFGGAGLSEPCPSLPQPPSLSSSSSLCQEEVYSHQWCADFLVLPSPQSVVYIPHSWPHVLRNCLLSRCIFVHVLKRSGWGRRGILHSGKTSRHQDLKTSRHIKTSRHQAHIKTSRHQDLKTSRHQAHMHLGTHKWFNTSSSIKVFCLNPRISHGR